MIITFKLLNDFKCINVDKINNKLLYNWQKWQLVYIMVLKITY